MLRLLRNPKVRCRVHKGTE